MLILADLTEIRQTLFKIISITELDYIHNIKLAFNNTMIIDKRYYVLHLGSWNMQLLKFILNI